MYTLLTKVVIYTYFAFATNYFLLSYSVNAITIVNDHSKMLQSRNYLRLQNFA